MKKFLKIAGVLLGLAILVLAWPAYLLYDEIARARSEDPLVWDADVRALEERSRGRFAPGEAVVFVGSSSIRLWDTLAEDMAPMPVLRHGFGGAKLNDVVHYAERLVNAWQPRAVVLFAGTNDIQPGASKTPDALLDSFRAFVATVRQSDPDLPVFYIEITPSRLRWEVWPLAQQANALLRDWGRTQHGLHFIDTAPALLGADGLPDRRLYRFDGLHLNAAGYAAWTNVIKPFLRAGIVENGV